MDVGARIARRRGLLDGDLAGHTFVHSTLRTGILTDAGAAWIGSHVAAAVDVVVVCTAGIAPSSDGKWEHNGSKCEDVSELHYCVYLFLMFRILFYDVSYLVL